MGGSAGTARNIEPKITHFKINLPTGPGHGPKGSNASGSEAQRYPDHHRRSFNRSHRDTEDIKGGIPTTLFRIPILFKKERCLCGENAIILPGVDREGDNPNNK
ncbi:hypothetical protein ABEB36_000062 [Hypothenemus hampei]|uniref:Uncharacterized protein n=1 Tax=Hypothenemus hampei TaxID=57062 RepID=A0ABD1FA46_HYPHA